MMLKSMWNGAVGRGVKIVLATSVVGAATVVVNSGTDAVLTTEIVGTVISSAIVGACVGLMAVIAPMAAKRSSQ